jgi:hypothetical protein
VGAWQQLYLSSAQSLYALWAVPALFLAYVCVVRPERPSMVAPGASRLMRLYAIAFAIETMLDPFATGPLSRQLGLTGRPGGTAVQLLFVLLGDFRVFLLIFYLTAVGMRPSTGSPREIPLLAVLGRAARWTFVVPLVAWPTYTVGRMLVPALPGQSLWLIYEVAFVVLALWMRQRLVPREVMRSQWRIAAYLRDVTAYVALYYALWAAADVVIMIAGRDAGWGLRMIPNQLYYGLYLPVVYALFFSRRYAVSKRSVQASR